MGSVRPSGCRGTRMAVRYSWSIMPPHSATTRNGCPIYIVIEQGIKRAGVGGFIPKWAPHAENSYCKFRVSLSQSLFLVALGH